MLFSVMRGIVVSINISEGKGTRKRPVEKALLREDFGIVGDAHASPATGRQLSLLAMESIRKMKERGVEAGPGDFAENVTTEGLDLSGLSVGMRICLGAEAEGIVTQIGKDCHGRCEIYSLTGDCIMPEEGVFVKLTKGGALRPGDLIEAQ